MSSPLLINLRASSQPLVIWVELQNQSDTEIRIGGINEGNMRINLKEDVTVYATRRMACPIPNSSGTHVLVPGESAEFSGDLKPLYHFPQAGIYDMVIVYDSLDFPDRFADVSGIRSREDRKWFVELAALTPIRSVSNHLDLHVPESIVEDMS